MSLCICVQCIILLYFTSQSLSLSLFISFSLCNSFENAKGESEIRRSRKVRVEKCKKAKKKGQRRTSTSRRRRRRRRRREEQQLNTEQQEVQRWTFIECVTRAKEGKEKSHQV